MISVEIVGNPENQVDPEILRHAAASVFHYFKIELARETVTVGEFALALEKVLRKFGLNLNNGALEACARKIIEADLASIASESADSLELFFFPRLRDELRTRLRLAPRILRFHGLRGCVKQLAGARRWSHRCEKMQEQIVGYTPRMLHRRTGTK